jgi:hypothetical protein
MPLAWYITAALADSKLSPWATRTLEVSAFTLSFLIWDLSAGVIEFGLQRGHILAE